MLKLATEIKLVKNTAYQLSRKSFRKKDYKNFFKPIDYTRTAEIPAIIFDSDILSLKENELKILDISSPQILSISLAQFSKKWQLDYINSFQPELDEMNNLAKTLQLNNITTQIIDITRFNDLDRISEKYDFIFSSSVFEHIYPEENGDILAIKNMFGLLKPRGKLILSVPFYFSSFNEYKYGDVYHIKGQNGKKSFFQRFYDEQSLYQRLVHPSGLIPESQLFIGEKYYFQKNIKKRIAQKLQSRFSAIILGKLFFFISSIFFTYSKNYKELKKPYIAILTLRKN